MPDSTLEAPPLSPGPAARPPAASPQPRTLGLFTRARFGWASAVVLIGASLGLVEWARTRPSFDAYGWLVWGHQTLAGSLNTNAAPSWKPLPYVFTVPYALFGHSELWLWMVTSVAISLSGAVFAARIAYRLSAAPLGSSRWSRVLAAAFAAASVLLIQDWWHYTLSAQSDTMILALCLAAVDSHLSGHPRWAFALGALASLGRPEVWPLEAAYAIWAWRAIPSMRRQIGIGVLAIALLWFGVPALTSRSPFVAASNAFGSGRRLRSDQVGGTLQRFRELQQIPLEIAALLSLCWAAIRRDLTLLTIGAGVVVWVGVEVAFALHGWPGLGRYMFGAAALTAVLAAVLVGRIASVGWLGLGIALALAGALVPTAISRVNAERHDLHLQRLRTTELGRLGTVLARFGGPRRLRACGEPLTRLEYQTALAWNLRVNVAAVGFKYPKALRHGNPVVFFTPIPAGGWSVHAVHQRSGGCPVG